MDDDAMDDDAIRRTVTRNKRTRAEQYADSARAQRVAQRRSAQPQSWKRVNRPVENCELRAQPRRIEATAPGAKHADAGIAGIIVGSSARLQLPAPGDKIDDPSAAWASTNEITTLGTLTVASVVPDSETTERALMFLPALLPAGIEPADPMTQFRNKTYPVSYERRHQTQAAKTTAIVE